MCGKLNIFNHVYANKYKVADLVLKKNEQFDKPFF